MRGDHMGSGDRLPGDRGVGSGDRLPGDRGVGRGDRLQGDPGMNRGNRPRGAFWRLLQKEMRQAAPVVGVIAAVVVAWHLFLYTRIDKWPLEAIFGLSVLPFGFVPLWLLWRSFATMRQEWAGNHMYLLLSLPVPGWYIAASKALIVMVEAAVFTMVIGTGSVLLAWYSGFLATMPLEAIRPEWGQVAVLSGVALLSPLGWIIITQFSYVAGRLASKFSGLVSALVFVLSGWFIVRAGTVLSPLFRWVPDMPLSADAIVDGVVMKAGWTLDWTPAIGTILALGVLFWMAASLLERDVEL